LQGFEWEALNGSHGPFSRGRYSQSLPLVDNFHFPYHPPPINGARDPSHFKLPTRQLGLDSLYEDDIHLDYMDYDLEEPILDPRGLPTKTGGHTKTTRRESGHTTISNSKYTSPAKPPPSSSCPPASDGAAQSILLKPPFAKPVQQPVDRVMLLQQRPDALRLSNPGSSTTLNNNSLYNRQLDFTPSLLSQPPAEYVLDATFWKIEARDTARKTGAIEAKLNDPKVVTSDQQLGWRRVKGHKENGDPQNTPQPPHAGFLRRSRPSTEDKRSRPPKSKMTAVESCITVKTTSEKASYGSAHTAEIFPAPYGDATSSNDSTLLGSLEVANELREADAEVYESEKLGGGRLIPSGFKVARRKDEDIGLDTMKLLSRRVLDEPPVPTTDVPENTASNGPQPAETHKLALPDASATLPLPQNSTNAPSDATTASVKRGAPRHGRCPGARGQWRGYVLAGDCPPKSKGKLLLLDAPPTLLPQRSTRSGRVFKPREGGSSSDQASEYHDNEEEKRVNRRRRTRRAAAKRLLAGEDSDK
jgi:hypothetical protein